MTTLILTPSGESPSDTYVEKPTGISSGEAPVWNGSSWVKSSTTKIGYSSLALTGAVLNADLAGSIAYSKLSLAGSLLNADVSTSAAIAVSKLAAAPLALAYSGAAQAISNSTWTAVTPLATEVLDTDTMHDTATNSGRLTVKTAGKYLLFAHVGWASSATGVRAIRFRLNGSTAASQGFSSSPALALAGTGPSHIFLATGAVNDYFEVEIYQDSGGSLNTATAHFGAVRVST